MTNQVLSRSLARLLAVQTIYSQDMLQDKNGHTKVAKNLSENYRSGSLKQELEIVDPIEIDEKFLHKLLELYQENEEKVDEHIIDNMTKSKDIGKIDALIRAILRAAVIELAFFDSSPTKMIIDEYVSMTRDFFGKELVGFVNAMLDSLSKQIRSTGAIIEDPNTGEPS